MLQAIEKTEHDEETATEILKEYVKSRDKEGEEIDIPALCGAVQNEFPASFFERLGRELLHQTIYRIIVREYQPAHAITKLQTRVRQGYKDWESEKGRSIFSSWHEYVEPGRKVPLLQMTQTDFRKASRIWGEREEECGSRRLFLEALARRCKDGRKCGEVWRLDEIANMAKKHGVVTE